MSEEVQNTERILDWGPNHDPRSKNFAVRTLIKTAVTPRNKLWRVGPILDQGYEGACVGFGWTAEALSTPVAVDLTQMRVKVPTEPNAFARSLYRNAQRVDEWDGENYEGTSVLAGAKVMKILGLMSEYRWAFSVQDVVDSVLTKGPVVIGIWWYSGMYEAPNGVLSVTGSAVGGHCLTIVGYRLAAYSKTGRDSFILQNSWGKSWGINGLAEIPVDELGALLLKDGEACVPVVRSYGR